jgi:hypothetical protein
MKGASKEAAMTERAPNTDETHDLENTVVAVLDAEPHAEEAAARLSAAGYDYEILKGEEGRQHLDPTGETGLIATLNRLISAFGDQHRILDQLDEALEEGKTVVSVRLDEKDPADAISILQDHGGHYVWRLGTWTFNRIGSD